MLNGLVFFHAELIHDARNVIRTKKTHQVVFKGKIKTRRPWVSLTGTASAELVIDAA